MTVSISRPKVVKLTSAECAALHERAHAAGLIAGGAAQPTPIIVYTPKDPFGAPKGDLIRDADLSQPVYHENEGVCGFGWVHIKPSKGGFASWARDEGKRGSGRALGYYSEYERACVISSPLRTQSYERNVAYCRAYAAVLQLAGIHAQAGGRLD